MSVTNCHRLNSKSSFASSFALRRLRTYAVDRDKAQNGAESARDSWMSEARDRNNARRALSESSLPLCRPQSLPMWILVSSCVLLVSWRLR
jgi:hypothetical protein